MADVKHDHYRTFGRREGENDFPNTLLAGIRSFMGAQVVPPIREELEACIFRSEIEPHTVVAARGAALGEVRFARRAHKLLDKDLRGREGQRRILGHALRGLPHEGFQLGRRDAAMHEADRKRLGRGVAPTGEKDLPRVGVAYRLDQALGAFDAVAQPQARRGNGPIGRIASW